MRESVGRFLAVERAVEGLDEGPVASTAELRRELDRAVDMLGPDADGARAAAEVVDGPLLRPAEALLLVDEGHQHAHVFEDLLGLRAIANEEGAKAGLGSEAV